MRSLFAAAIAAAAAFSTGCYGPMYSPNYGYSSPGYPVSPYGGSYPGPINTLTPGAPYAPGTSIPGGYQSVPGSTIQPYNGGTNAPSYSPPSATRPAPTYGTDPYQTPSPSGGQPMGMNDAQPIQQRISSSAFETPSSIPQNNAAPIGGFEEGAFGGLSEDTGDATLQKFPPPTLPATYRPAVKAY